MQKEIKNIYNKARKLHHETITALAELGEGDPKLSERAELVFGLKKTEDMLEDLRKEITKVRKGRELICCLGFYQAEVDSIKTVYCSAKVHTEQFVKFPHKKHSDPERFERLMKSLDIPEEVINHEAVRFNWNGFKTLFTQRQVQGLPMLEGVDFDDVYTEFSLRFRKGKPIEATVD